MIVPDDDHELADEFRRRGVRPGARLRVVVSEQVSDDDHDLPDYFGSFTAAPDLAGRSEGILRAEFPAFRS